jgi:hypothetical protein
VPRWRFPEWIFNIKTEIHTYYYQWRSFIALAFPDGIDLQQEDEAISNHCCGKDYVPNFEISCQAFFDF